MKRHAILATLVALNMVGLFLAQLLVFFEFGAGSIADAFMASLTVPQTLGTIVSVLLTSVLIPQLSGERDRQQREDGWAVLALLGSVFIIVSGTLSFGAPWWVPVVFHGFPKETESLCVELTRISSFSPLFFVASAVAASIYQARDRFVFVAAMTCLASFFVVLGVYVLLPVYGVLAVAWITLLGAVLQFVLLMPALGEPTPSLLRWERPLALWKSARPMLIGNLYCKGEVLLDRFLLSTGAVGDMSLYTLGRQIFEGAAGVVSKTLAGTVLPGLSVHFKRGEWGAFGVLFRRRLWLLAGACTIGAIVFLVAGKWLLQLLVGYGQMTTESVGQLWWVMVLMGGVFVFGVVGSLSAIAFYATGDTRTPTYLSMASLTIFAVVKVGAYRYYGVDGLAAGTSLYLCANFIAMMLTLPARLTRGAMHGQ